jgi:holo-[acyl-carrier protein] synthase
MILGIGTDVENIKDIQEKIKEENFKKLIFTKKEIEYCESKKEPWISYAGKFCAKEAIKKAIQEDAEMKEIEILLNEKSKPTASIKNKIRNDILCSISHTKDYATATAILESSQPNSS